MGYSGVQSMGADAVNCGYNYLTALDNYMTGTDSGSVPRFTLVETYTGVAPARWKVWKSAVADNGVKDFYISAYVATAASVSVYFGLAEDYDSVTNHTLMKYVPYDATSLTVNQTDYTVTDSPGKTPAQYTGYYGCTLTISTGAYSYWFSINHHRIHVTTRISATDYGLYAGMTTNMLDETALPTSAVSLALMKQWDGSKTFNSYGVSSTYCGFTREPGQASTGLSNFSAIISSSYGMWPYIAGSASYDSVYKAGWMSGRIPIFSNRENTSLYYPRALLWPGHIFSPRNSSAVNGDSLTIGSTTYAMMRIGSSGIVFVDTSL